MSRRWRRVRVALVVGLALTSLLVVAAAVSLVWTPADPLAMSIAGRLEAPSRAHPFGTDQYGRDVLARVMAGTVTSIAVGFLAVAVGAGVGIPLGVAGGYVGGWVDETLMRLVDAVQGFPAILSALLFRRGLPSRDHDQHGGDRDRLRPRLRAPGAGELPRAPRARVRAGGRRPGRQRCQADRPPHPAQQPVAAHRPGARPASRSPSSPKRPSHTSGWAPSRRSLPGGSCSRKRRISSP